jgi:hypothetical protein
MKPEPRVLPRASAIACYVDYRRSLGRLVELLEEDPALDTPEAEDLLDAIAAYVVAGGRLDARDWIDFLRRVNRTMVNHGSGAKKRPGPRGARRV